MLQFSIRRMFNDITNNQIPIKRHDFDAVSVIDMNKVKINIYGRN